VTQVFADAATAFGKTHSIDWEGIDMVAAHGQTCWHIPLPENAQIKSTLQLMESTAISQALSVNVVSDFRTGEVSAGRHGAPLVAFIDALLASHETLSRSVLNM
jgi:anhydro-N-acetylmuramic acid kinase